MGEEGQAAPAEHRFKGHIGRECCRQPRGVQLKAGYHQREQKLQRHSHRYPGFAGQQTSPASQVPDIQTEKVPGRAGQGTQCRSHRNGCFPRLSFAYLRADDRPRYGWWPSVRVPQTNSFRNATTWLENRSKTGNEKPTHRPFRCLGRQPNRPRTGSERPVPGYPSASRH